MKLLAIDGNSIVNRAFYGIKLLTTKDGRYTNAIVGFMNILQKLQAEEQPDSIAIAWDLRAPTFRHKMFDDYKGTRHGMPEELAAQMPVLKELLTALGYHMVAAEGFEADDILGTLAAAAEQHGDTCVIATGDRDALQLVTSATRVLLAGTAMGRSTTTNMDEAAVVEKYGVSPKQLIEVKALMGDASDNIPGVKGVGEKTALTLISKFGSLDGVYANIDDPVIKPAAREKLLRDKEQAYLSHVLAEIVTNAPVPTNPADYCRSKGDPEVASRLLANLEMYNLRDKLGLSSMPVAEEVAPDAAPAELPQVAPQPLPAKLTGSVDIAPVKEGFVLVQGNQVYTAVAEDEAFLVLLQDEKVKKRCYDSKAVYLLCADARNFAFDALLAAYLLNPASRGYDLLQLASQYNAAAAFTCEIEIAPLLTSLFDALAADCEAQGMTKLLEEIEQPLARVLCEMERAGVLVDRQGIVDFGVELRGVIETELAAIYSLVGYEFNVNSPKQLGEALFEKLGLPTQKKTKSGFSTDAETLEALRSHHEVIEHILLYRTYQKLNSTYVEGLLKAISEDGRIHSTFNQTETRTGRISSGEPNLQNIPVRTELGSRLRKYFVAPQGSVLLDADYSQIELRILASISGDKHMIEAFKAGEDIHRATASRIFDVPMEKVSAQLRSRAKAVNFGIVYGIGAFSLAKDTGVSVKEADAFIKHYLEEYSGVHEYMERTVREGKEQGYVTTLYGRRRALPELAASNRNIRALGERLAMNTPIQGTAADIIKLAMIRVANRLREEGLSARLILQVHDELIVEAPIAEADKAAKILGEEMTHAADLAVALPADVARGENWYAAKG